MAKLRVESFSISIDGGRHHFSFRYRRDSVQLEQARNAAKGKDVRLGGGAAMIRQYLREALIDEMHIAIAPVPLGSGERLFDDIDLPRLGYKSTSTPYQRQRTSCLRA